jgi:hypothetical protein
MSTGLTGKKINFGFLFYTLFTSILFTTCQTGDDPESLQVIPLPTTDILYALDVSPDNQVTLVGGYVWERGIAVYTDIYGHDAVVDTFSNKGQHDLLRDSKSQLITVGTDGYLFVNDGLSRDWQFKRLSHWDILHNILEVDEGYLASGGKSYEQGYVYLINDQFVIDTAIYTGHEIADIARSGTGRLVSVGWGTIQYADDGGKNWKTTDNEGDFFSSVVFTDSNTGFITGFNGTLLTSSDDGLTWSDYRGEIKGNGYNSFRKIKYLGNGELIITGNNGKIWRSMNEGKDWTYFRLSTRADLYDIAKIANGRYLVCGSNGFFGIATF